MSAMANDLEIPAGGSTVGNAVEDDSDWEYEYHETETEVHDVNPFFCIMVS